MSVELTEHPAECASKHGSFLSAVALRFKSVETQYPAASRSLLSILDQALVSGTSFVTAVIVGRMTSVNELGLYYLILSIVVLASGVQEQVISGPYMVLSKRRSGAELAEFAGSIWLHHLVLSLLTMGGLGVAIVFFSVMGSVEILRGLWVLLFVGPLLFLRDGVRRFAFANLQVKSAIALDAAILVMQFGGLLLLAHFSTISILGVYAVIGGAGLLACLGWFLLAPRNVRFCRRQFMPDWFHNWAFGKWALWSFVVTGTTPAVMLWILGLAFGPSATAMLGVCATLIGVTNVILAGVANVLTPLAAQAFAVGGASELRGILSRTATFVAIFLGSTSLLAWAFGDQLVVLVFGAQYQGTGMIPFTLALSALMAGLGMVVGNGLWAIHQPRSAFIGDVCGVFVTLTVSTLLILPFGPLGAALATLAGATVATVARTVILVRYFADDALNFNAAPNAALCPDGINP